MQYLNFKNLLLKQKKKGNFMNLAKQHQHVALNICCTYFGFFFFVHKCLLCILHGQCTIIQFQPNFCVCDYFGISWKSSRLKAQCSCRFIIFLHTRIGTVKEVGSGRRSRFNGTVKKFLCFTSLVLYSSLI